MFNVLHVDMTETSKLVYVNRQIKMNKLDDAQVWTKRFSTFKCYFNMQHTMPPTTCNNDIFLNAWPVMKHIGIQCKIVFEVMHVLQYNGCFFSNIQSKNSLHFINSVLHLFSHMDVKFLKLSVTHLNFMCQHCHEKLQEPKKASQTKVLLSPSKVLLFLFPMATL